MKVRTPIAEVVGTGRALPERVMTNRELERMVDTSDSWIRERTGIVGRRIAAPGVGTAELAAEASRQAMAAAGAVRSMTEAAEMAMERAGMSGDDVDLLLPHQANLRIDHSESRHPSAGDAA